MGREETSKERADREKREARIARFGNSSVQQVDEQEQQEWQEQEWQQLREAVTDRERKELASKEFSNPVMSNPGQPLTFHGYRRHRSGLQSRCQPGSFAISEGEQIPLAGVKRKARQSIGPPSTAKVVKLKDFSRVVKSRMSEIMLKSQGGLSEDTVEELQMWGNHYHVGLRETADFLSYYSERKGAYLVQLHAEEVLDLQEVAGRSSEEYGEKTRDITHCKGCDAMHKSIR